MNHEATWVAVRAERALLAALEGGCQVPIGALVVDGPTGGHLLHAVISDLAGQHVLRGEAVVDPRDPETTGRQLALEMLNRGAWEILGKLRASSQFPSPQPE
jgi:hydroxymethylbilane synthase